MTKITYLANRNSKQIAVWHREANLQQQASNTPTLLFLGGFGSDMSGSKAQYLDSFAAKSNLAITLFDYSGCGQSQGDFLAAGFDDWYYESEQLLLRYGGDRCILIGSSMGGWLALLLAKAYPQLIAGVILLAAAPDFPQRLVLPQLDQEARKQFRRKGYLQLYPDLSDAPGLKMSYHFYRTSMQWQIFSRASMIKLAAPVSIIHGMLDSDVPWSHSLLTSACIANDSQQLILLPTAGHRLSRPQDLVRIRHELTAQLQYRD